MRRLALALPLLVLVPSTARAERLTSPPLPPQPIYGGTPVEACGWPTTVHLDGCTGTLVHPELVVFAAHCMFFTGGQGPATADFGETVDAPARQIPTAGCTMFPGWVPDESQFGNDIAFCTLGQPVTDVPIVPILMGCETDVLVPDQEITLVGFGIDDFGMFGTKREVTTIVNGFEGPEINVGGNGTSSCNGDSGGPAYVQLEDGSWRVFGITSRGTTGNCNDPSIYGLMYSHVEWLETESGLDLTPCHDADGTWNPGESCGGFPLTPSVGDTAWDQGCTALRLSGPSATCGDPFVEETGSTGDTGLDGTADGGSSSDGSGTTGLPGGTAEGSTGGSSDGTTGDGTGDTTSAQDDPDDVVTCTCRTDAPLPRPLALLLLLVPAFRPRRRRSPASE